uniref:AAA+ ATPase domain-containing protein n=1 Tax=Bionectria ochroleuca TaxID=29856 RepID=A0A8H7N5S2_BIOOC
MASAQPISQRDAKLTQRFKSCLHGSKQIDSLQDAKHFFEAACINCRQENPSKTLEMIVLARNGLEALSAAARRSLSVDFLAESVVPFLMQLQGAAVRNLGDGHFIEKALKCLLIPASLWNAFVEGYTAKSLKDDALIVFAWLCLEVVSSRLPGLSAQQEEVHEARVYGYRIEKVLSIHGVRAPVAAEVYGPGGRHDNDFQDFHDISIYPTHDELLSKEKPYLQRLEDAFRFSGEDRAGAYLDWLFRQLREDMVADLKEETQISMGRKKGRGRSRSLFRDLSIKRDTHAETRLGAFTVTLHCGSGMQSLLNMPKAKREKFLENHKAVFRHDSLAVLFSPSAMVAFGSMVKLKSSMLNGESVFGLQLKDKIALNNTVAMLLGPQRDQLALAIVESATFAYEPILRRLQSMNELPLEEPLLVRGFSQAPLEHSGKFDELVKLLKERYDESGEITFGPKLMVGEKPLRLQGAQLKSFINGLSNPRILVLSYTNHALDQFITDLVAIGVNKKDIVRLGSKVAPGMEAMRLESRTKDPKYWCSNGVRHQIRNLKSEEGAVKRCITELVQNLERLRPSTTKILGWLEFSENYGSYFTAFSPLSTEDGFTLQRHKDYDTAERIYDNWRRGKGPSPQYLSQLSEYSQTVLKMEHNKRQELDRIWCQEVRQEDTEDLCSRHEELHRIQNQMNRLHDESKRNVLQSTRVICCTTTGASMYQSNIKTAQPDVVLVEEAGEILEAHVIAACSSTVKQLVLIGDHKQLRPKVNSYELSVEKGEGFDLNKSLFERRIEHGHEFTVLEEQHRSHPDISHFSRLLSYPTLVDAPKVAERPGVRGLQHRVVFVHHEHPEQELADSTELRDPSAGNSKRNPFEVEMVLRTIKYLSQQGYKTENMVVLTPYLGQLSLMRSELSSRTQIDPLLNDLDFYELIRAGLMTNVSAKEQKARVRLSTIDNYQGEESDIVIASLTRSNASGDIGFLCARERLVVLMSRAREGIILFGNMHTFMKSKRGKELWTQYFDILREKKWLVEGLPIRCEQHPDRVQEVKTPEEFDRYCPDAGRCFLAGNMFVKGVVIFSPTTRRRPAFACNLCVKQDQDIARRAKRDFEMEKKRMERQQEYATRTLKLDEDIAEQRRALRYDAEEAQEAADLKKKEATLKELEARRKRAQELVNRKDQEARTRKTAPPKGDEKSLGSQRANGPISPAEQEWNDMKDQGEANQALDELMELIGLESVKDELSCSLLGNPGTGKTTVARLWGKFLTSIGAVVGDAFEETTGSKLASGGVPGCEKLIEGIKDRDGGVLFIDEAYQLSSGNSPGGKAVLDYLLAEVENLRGQVIFILAGYEKEMESFFAHNPGLPSRFAITMKFEDYDDDELLRILKLKLHEKFKGTMILQDGTDGLYARIIARRVGRGRGKPGFGNARAVENTLDKILKRQASRIRKEKRSKNKSDELFLSKTDLIGPEPSNALESCTAWTKLNQLIGLNKVKGELQVFKDTVITNYHRELAEEPLIEFSLNKVFVGSPGTGKTTVAKLFGQVLSHIGLLSNGEVVVKSPADFIGSVLGESEAKTKGILAATAGKVLVIDEAYGLYGGENISDPYKTGVIDTIVAEVQSVPGEDRCVLLLGYDEQMQKMFQNVNPGLTRRFPLDSSFVFEDFNDDELSRIFDLKVKQCGFKTTGRGKTAALEVLTRARNRPHFGNAGEVDILLDKAKASHQKRRSAGGTKSDILDAMDFDEDFDRHTRTDTNVRALFDGDVGREKLITLLEGYQARVRELKSLGMDPKEEIPFSFLFRGPPGTGKTTVARKMGKVYYDMGFLARAEVIDCSATDLIGQYVGQTGPKVQALLDKALGKVLFIDEAYRLAGGQFAQEAVDELVDSVTKPKYFGKLIIILAGYVEDINNLLSVNQGMSSRFPETIDFEPLQPKECFQLLVSLLQSKKRQIQTNAKGKTLDVSCLEVPSNEFQSAVLGLFDELSQQDGWASARDVKQLAKTIFRSVNLSFDKPTVFETDVRTELKSLLLEQKGRMQKRKSNSTPLNLQQISLQNMGDLLDQQPKTRLTMQNKTQQYTDATLEDISEEASDAEGGDCASSKCLRDVGVSDEVWEQLEKDKAAEAEAEAKFRKLKKEQKTCSDERREEIIRQVVQEEEKRRKIAAEKARIERMGCCPVGFAWIKQENGYRCAGGSHFISQDCLNSS